MKIFIGLSEVAGYFSGLKNGFEKIGIKATLVDLNFNPFNYAGSNDDGLLLQLLLFFIKKRNQEQSFLYGKIIIFFERLFRLIYFIRVLIIYDVFIFSPITSFFKYKELPILKFFKKKIIYIFTGSDSRPPYLDGSIMAEDRNKTFQDCINLTQRTKNNINVISKYADFIIDNIPHTLLQERKIISWLSIGIPCRLKKNIENVNLNRTNEVKILHCPSHPEAKGTDIIRKYINNLKDKGYKIDYIEVIGKPNNYVIEKIIECDFIIDQIYSDQPMPVFSSEASFFAKPTIISGYFAEVINEYVDIKNIPPSLYCKLEDLEISIEKMINDIDFRINLGLNAKKFLDDNWKSDDIARKYLKIINNDADESWFFDPYNLEYIYGCCINKDKIKYLVKNMIEIGGIKSLQLSDKPKIEQMFLDFIKD